METLVIYMSKYKKIKNEGKLRIKKTKILLYLLLFILSLLIVEISIDEGKNHKTIKTINHKGRTMKKVRKKIHTDINNEGGGGCFNPSILHTVVIEITVLP